MLLTEGNWQQTVFRAVAELPEDIKTMVAVDAHPGKVVVRVAVNSYDRDREADICCVNVELFAAQRDSLDEGGWKDLDPGYWQFLCEQMKKTGDWPVITAQSEMLFVPGEGVYVDRGQCEDLVKLTQKHVLECLHSGGRPSGVCVDEKNRYVRDDGTVILAWQFDGGNES